MEIQPEQAYQNDHVIRAFTSSDWFTPSFVEEVHVSEPEPNRSGLGHFEDQRLGRFFLQRLNLGRGNEVFNGANLFLTLRMASLDGHPLILRKIPFFDEEIQGYADKLNVDDSYVFDRANAYEIEKGLICMIAPEDLRRKVIKVTCTWGTKEWKTDTLLWTQLVRKGAQQYIETKWRHPQLGTK
jgi:hypothetical protein